MRFSSWAHLARSVNTPTLNQRTAVWKRNTTTTGMTPSNASSNAPAVRERSAWHGCHMEPAGEGYLYLCVTFYKRRLITYWHFNRLIFVIACCNNINVTFHFSHCGLFKWERDGMLKVQFQICTLFVVLIVFSCFIVAPWFWLFDTSYNWIKCSKTPQLCCIILVLSAVIVLDYFELAFVFLFFLILCFCKLFKYIFVYFSFSWSSFSNYFHLFRAALQQNCLNHWIIIFLFIPIKLLWNNLYYIKRFINKGDLSYFYFIRLFVHCHQLFYNLWLYLECIYYNLNSFNGIIIRVFWPLFHFHRRKRDLK